MLISIMYSTMYFYIGFFGGGFHVSGVGGGVSLLPGGFPCFNKQEKYQQSQQQPSPPTPLF